MGLDMFISGLRFVARYSSRRGSPQGKAWISNNAQTTWSLGTAGNVPAATESQAFQV